jgi:hypothetical protein
VGAASKTVSKFFSISISRFRQSSIRLSGSRVAVCRTWLRPIDRVASCKPCCVGRVHQHYNVPSDSCVSLSSGLPNHLALSAPASNSGRVSVVCEACLHAVSQPDVREVSITLGRAGSAYLTSVAVATLNAVRRALAITSHLGLSMSYLPAAHRARSHDPPYRWVATPNQVRMWLEFTPLSYVHGCSVAAFTVCGVRYLVQCF